jgi:hypothetical protein
VEGEHIVGVTFIAVFWPILIIAIPVMYVAHKAGELLTAWINKGKKNG